MFDWTGRLSPKENYIQIFKAGYGDYLCHSDEYSKGRLGDPLAVYYASHPRGISKDPWGVTYYFKEDAVAANPYVTEENKVIKDIRQWDHQLKEIPWASSLDLDWSETEKKAEEFDREHYMLICGCYTGLFELTHNLMGFEDALCNYLEEPEAMGELLDVLCDFKLDYLKTLFRHVKPDMMFVHDDWGNKKDLFMAPAVWRKLLKPRWEKIYGFIKSQGIYIQHHADCVCAPIVEDMVDLGIDIWQGAIPENNLVQVQKKLKGRMAIQGGIDNAILDKIGYTKEEVKKEVRRACDEYAANGYFIPSLCAQIPMTPGLYEDVRDELNSYGEHFYERLSQKNRG